MCTYVVGQPDNGPSDRNMSSNLHCSKQLSCLAGLAEILADLIRSKSAAREADSGHSTGNKTGSLDHFVHHRSDTNWLGSNPGLCSERRAIALHSVLPGVCTVSLSCCHDSTQSL